MPSKDEDGKQIGLARLAAEFPWPNVDRSVPNTSFGWGIEGKELFDSKICHEPTCIIEIGTLLGGSARQFADTWPTCTIVCIDPWFDKKDRALLRLRPDLRHWLDDVKDGLFQVFLASNQAYQHRLIPMRGYSPAMLMPVYRAGVHPDFIYIDGSHEYEDVLVDISVSHLLFPEAQIGGDDWKWESVRRAVEHYAARQRLSVATMGNTWLLE
jgi:hypothetical protein